MSYQPIPVDVARQIAERFSKSIVVIIAHDPVHGLMHTTTYGVGSIDKQQAAQLGDVAAAACGADLSKRRTFSDFRHTSEAQHAQNVDLLVRALRAADDAMVCMRPYAGVLPPDIDEKVQSVRAAIAAAIGEANRGGADGDTPGS